MEKYYKTIKEFAKECEVSEALVRRWARHGRVKAMKMGRDWIIDKDTVKPEDRRLVENPVRNRRKHIDII